jgi:hypothetical protein
MRKIPATITDPAMIKQLQEINAQIESKMKLIKKLKDDSQLADLKKISVEIDALDQQWKKTAGIE